jgi:lysozyme family protein
MNYDPIFNKLIGPLLNREGGYVNNPNDRGGATKFGISQASYPSLNIATLTRPEAEKIYYNNYWLASGG